MLGTTPSLDSQSKLKGNVGKNKLPHEFCGSFAGKWGGETGIFTGKPAKYL